MESIYSFFQSYENIKVRKTNLNAVIEKFNTEINKDFLQLYKALDLNYSKDIHCLEEKKHFLEDYPSYMKSGIKGLFKNILMTTKITALVFGLLMLSLMIMYVPQYGYSRDIIFISLFLAGIISFYGCFIEPVICNYNQKKYILNKYGNIEDIERKIKNLEKQKVEHEEYILFLKETIKQKELRMEQLQDKYNQLLFLENNANKQLQNAFDSIWNEIYREYYIYEENIIESNSLKLTK